jgi:hypothetical protein
MARQLRSWRIWGPGLLLVVGIATMARAQLGVEAGTTRPAAPSTMEYTQQEVLTNSLVDTLNEMGKQHWEIFQVVPVWKVQDQGGGAELVPVRYQILGRRPKAAER